MVKPAESFGMIEATEKCHLLKAGVFQRIHPDKRQILEIRHHGMSTFMDKTAKKANGN